MFKNMILWHDIWFVDNKSLPLHRFSGREHLLSGLTNEQSGRKHRVKRSRFCINLNWITW